MAEGMRDELKYNAYAKHSALRHVYVHLNEHQIYYTCANDNGEKGREKGK